MDAKGVFFFFFPSVPGWLSLRTNGRQEEDDWILSANPHRFWRAGLSCCRSMKYRGCPWYSGGTSVLPLMETSEVLFPFTLVIIDCVDQQLTHTSSIRNSYCTVMDSLRCEWLGHCLKIVHLHKDFDMLNLLCQDEQGNVKCKLCL